MDLKNLYRSAEEVDRLFPWMREDLIRGIPHFISPAWTHDRSQFDAEYWADAWERIGFKSVTLLTGHHDGYLLYPSKLCNQQPDRDYFGEQVAACRKRGIRVMAYYSLTLDSLVGSEHPEWRVRDMEGRIYQPNYEYFSHYHWLCLNSPYRDHAVGQLEEVVTGYDVDGVWIDILYLPGHVADLTRETCFCEHCHRRYSELYAGEHLLDAAGTPRHDVFRAKTYRNFLAQLKTMLMAQDRPLALTFNGAGRRRMPYYAMSDKLADFLSGEAHDPTSLTITSKSHRNDGRPFELLSCSEVCWSHNQQKPDTLILLESLGTLIAGGTYTMGITLAPDGRLSEANVDRLAQWGKRITDSADLFAGAYPVYEMGILSGEGGPVGCEAWSDLLRKGHFLFNVFMDLDVARQGSVRNGGQSQDADALQAYRLMVVPAGRKISAGEAAELTEYVRAGGCLLIEDPKAQLLAAEPFMEELIGARLRRLDRAYAFYLAPLQAELADGVPEDEPVLVYSNEACIFDLTAAEAVGDLVPQFRDKVRNSDIQTVPNFWAREDEAVRPPGMIVNRIGEGLVMTNAVPLLAHNKDAHRCPWPQMLARNCVRFLLGQQMVSVRGYNRIEVSLCRQENRLVLHFLNHSYGPGSYMHGDGETEILRSLPVQLDSDLRQWAGSCTVEPGGQEIALTDDGFILPQLGVHQAVCLHPR